MVVIRARQNDDEHTRVGGYWDRRTNGAVPWDQMRERPWQCEKKITRHENEGGAIIKVR